ncbi:uncharacterized protein AB675_1691 [Cyphellophora attinorum]|uniref:Uncharacterized protein n=1 Tax=Cyphellophora attinorum TaxID=1664694 RepID=A0A0N0NIP9_9EURO|nr:uncharacterized protein AB675_1691 [Phialophora attinorum]KPI35998.1 hypothetical protein AB675_1691 [Phialophora attinorum]
MKPTYGYQIAAAALSLSTTVSGWMFAASADDHCQSIHSIVNVTDGRCIGNLTPFKSIWPLETYPDSAAQGAFAERATGKVCAMCSGLMEDSRVVRKGSGNL